MPAVIEFRSGTYFQNLTADHGGPLDTARVFDDKAAGMAVEVQLVPKLVPARMP